MPRKATKSPPIDFPSKTNPSQKRRASVSYPGQPGALCRADHKHHAALMMQINGQHYFDCRRSTLEIVAAFDLSSDTCHPISKRSTMCGNEIGAPIGLPHLNETWVEARALRSAEIC